MLRQRRFGLFSLRPRTSCRLLPLTPPFSIPSLVSATSHRCHSSSTPSEAGRGLLLSEEMREHRKWIEQKYILGQDMILLGLPTSLRRRLIAHVAQENGWNIEYLAITRDTTESDLKQRREIVGSTVIYTDQPPVRAALNGSILILEGIENAERNVLPTLNNLLENREMSLDDGRFLTRKPDNFDNDYHKYTTSKLAFVNENFRVIALGLPVPPYSGRSLDPPLRSRFQCRFIDEPTTESLLSAIDTSRIDKRKLQSLINIYESLHAMRESLMLDETNLTGLPVFSPDVFLQSLKLLNAFPGLSPFEALSRFIPSLHFLNYLLPDKLKPSLKIAISSLREGGSAHNYHLLSSIPAPSNPTLRQYIFQSQSSPSLLNDNAKILTTYPSQLQNQNVCVSALLAIQEKVLVDMLMDHTIGNHLCLLGPKGSGKSVIAREFAHITGYSSVYVFPLYSELTSRDLLQRRLIGKDGNTTWCDTPLIRAVREGGICILDGIHSLDVHSLVSLRRLLQDGIVQLPNGEILTVDPQSTFRVVALGLLPQIRSSSGKLLDHQLRYITADLNFAYHQVPDASPESVQALIKRFLKGEKPSHDMALLLKAMTCLHEVAGTDHPELKPSYRHALILATNLMSKGSSMPEGGLRLLLENTFLIRYLPGVLTDLFNVALNNAGIKKLENTIPSQVNMTLSDNQLAVGDMVVDRFRSENIEKVPRPLFYDNLAHRIALEAMLRTHLSDQYSSLLLIGNQGVGKNKLVDQMLYLLRREREYIQLHRDSTVQSLTILPSLHEGRIVFEDSPLLKAAKVGRVLVIDEADKAPIEVLCLLKMLVEDGELLLPDGRRLLSPQRIEQEFPDVFPSGEIIPIHPNFRLIVLANRPGYPFHGNNLFRECGDIFSVLVIENLDLSSEMSLLRAYGPDVPQNTIHRLALAFQDLRMMHERNELTYPFSAREAVSVVKHLQSFPEDGVAAAVENILSFECYNPRIRKLVAIVFQARGIPVSIKPGAKVISHDGDSMIKVAKVNPIPEPISYEIKEISAQRSRLVTSTSKLQIKSWVSNSYKIQPFTVHPARLFSFSEEMGRLFVGDSRTPAYSGKFNGMVVDRMKPNVLHVLTSFPLELHSYYPNNDDVSFFSGIGEGKCVTRLLIDPDIQWRLGDPEVTMSSLPNGGVSVFLYEHGTCLIVPGSDPENIHPVLQTSISPMMHSRTPRTTKTFSEKIIQSFQNVFEDEQRLKSKPEPLAIHRHGQQQMYLADFSHNILVTIQVPTISIRNITPLFSTNTSSSGIYHWIVTGDVGPSQIQTILTYSTNDGEATLSKILIQDPGKSSSLESINYTTGWEELKSEKWCVGDTVIWNHSNSCNPWTNQVAEWPGSSKYHAATMGLTIQGGVSNGQLTLLPRSEPLIRQNLIPGNNFSPSYVVNGVQDSRKGGNPLLEVVNTKSNELKVISLASAMKINKGEESFHLGALVSVATIRSPCGSWTLGVTLDSYGSIRFFELDTSSLTTSLSSWKQLMGLPTSQNINGELQRQRDIEGTSKPRFGVDKPKHGKEDEKNEPHVGGNTWAGGTGGSDTAGLGGRGGPYRLDKGHKIHQVSEADKRISAEAKARASEMAKAALEERMKDINMGKADFQTYERFRQAVQSQVTTLRQILEELSSRSHERKWLKNQNQGEFDDTKLVDGLTGDKLVFKKRGIDTEVLDTATGVDDIVKKRLQFVMDVSGSMYRFNGQDRRLERMLEAALMIMSSIPNENSIEYAITGHSGDTANITFVPFHSVVNNEKNQFTVLQKMVAHSQFCQSGDNTLESAEYAIKHIVEGSQTDEHCLRYVFVLSDANFERYGINSSDIRRILNKDPRVQVHFIFIASLGDEADRLVASLPKGRVHLCYESMDLPSIFKTILTSYGGAFDTQMA